MDRLPSSSWSYTSGRATRPPDKGHTILYTTLQEPVSKLIAWCHSLWRDLTQRLKNIHLQEERFNNKHIPLRDVRYGQVRIMEKPLPVLPLSAEPGFMPRAPPPLAQRQYLVNRPASLRLKPRPLTWSEDQINHLQEENRKLRSQIISQKRVDADKDHIISMLRQLNSQVNQDLRRQNEALARLADMAVAIRSSGHLPFNRPPSESPASPDHGTLDEVIQIYSDLRPDARHSDAIQSSGSTYTQDQVMGPTRHAHNSKAYNLASI
ncbi:hypothetical protein ACJZ2D_016423 [Fusarium nematophilum]